MNEHAYGMVDEDYDQQLLGLVGPDVEEPPDSWVVVLDLRRIRRLFDKLLKHLSTLTTLLNLCTVLQYSDLYVFKIILAIQNYKLI